MAYHHDVQLILLVRLDPAEAKKQILAAYRTHGGHEEHTAQALGVSSRTLRRWTNDLGLLDQVTVMRDRRRAAEAKVPPTGPARRGRPPKKRAATA